MQKESPLYHYYPGFVFRTPLIPFQQKPADEAALFTYSQQAFFKEAIYLASPVLHDEMLKWHRGELTDEKAAGKLVISLYKYFMRMQTRCTPYGLFAGCATGAWNNKNEVLLNNEMRRHTRLDMNYLCALAQTLNTHEAIFPLLSFYPNNSIYLSGGALRYTEYKYDNNRRAHQISAVDHSEYLQAVLDRAATGAPVDELARCLVSDEISYEEASAFITELVESQVLVSELEPAVTGDEFIYQVIGTLEKLGAAKPSAEIASIIAMLRDVQQQIVLIDKQVVNDTASYRGILGTLSGLNIPIEENQLFQTDLYKKPATAELNSSIQQQLSGMLEFMNRLSQKEENPALKKFKENFRVQYEDAEVPLSEVLDTETGIGYSGRDVLGINALVDDLYVAGDFQPSMEISWNSIQEILHKRLLNAYKHDEYTVVFTDDDLKAVNNRSSVLPGSITIMFRMLAEDKLFLQTCGGSSAANLLGRFAHGDQAIHAIINDITAHEQNLDAHKVLAEIVHLPESRLGNILLRPVLRGYEIPYLGKSALPAESQLPVQDLLVSVKHNRVVLRSRKLDKEVVPRLSTAHNYKLNTLPVYQFLGDLQTQDYEKSGFRFSWGPLSGSYKFLPRAEYGNIVLERAKWQLSKTDFKPLLDDKSSSYTEDVNEWRRQWKIPRYALLANGDNELLIDFDSPLSLKMLLHSIRKQDRIVLEEFLFDPGNLLVKDENGQGYTNEFIAVLLKNPAPAAAEAAKQPEYKPTAIQRDFALGSEWLYYKIYCGVKTADKLLSECIKPLTEQLLQNGLADRFFFIRYSDPDLHIRLRFHIGNPAHLGKVIGLVHEALSPWIDQGSVNKLQTESYKRELERYRPHLVEQAESLFFIDSICTLRMLDLIEGEEGEHFRWLFGLRSVDEMLNVFEYGPDDKLRLLERLKDNFTNEHGGSKGLKQQLNNKYRNVRQPMEEILNRELDRESRIGPLIELLAWKHGQVRPVAAQILAAHKNDPQGTDLDALMSSYLHMMLNRIFKSRQRTYEMVIYDLLHRYYKSAAGREKYRKKNAALKAEVINEEARYA